MGTSSRKPHSTVTALIDADVLAYEAANGEQRVYDWGDGITSAAMGTLDQAVADVLNAVAQLKEKLHVDNVVLCLSWPGERWRNKVLPSYHFNRAGNKPVLVDPLRDVLVEKHGAVRRPTLEGDDILGIYATHPTLIKGEKIIVSIDKDLKQIPGTLYNPRHDEFTTIDLMAADYWHFRQTLTGDATDGYKGCPNIGPIKADRILADLDRFGEMPSEQAAWKAIVEAYEAKELTEADALVQARVARICRHTDYDYKRKEVILWQPQR